MWTRCVIFWVLLAFPLMAAVTDGGASPSVSTAVEREGGTARKGDVIIFKSGTKLGGVQVLRADRYSVTVRALKGLAPLMIPISQIEMIEYDGYDPNQAGVGGGEAALRPPGMVKGVKLSPELDRKIIAPLPKASLRIENRDCVEFLASLAKQAAVKLSFAQAVKDIPKEERAWTVDIKLGTSLLSLLQEDLPKTFPDLKVVYQYDSILITTKRAYEAANGTP